MKVLVIGGTGWVGHEIALAFRAAGHEVEICTRGRKGDFVNQVGAFRHHIGDKTDPAFLRAVVGRGSFDAIIDSVPMPGVISLLAERSGTYGRYIHCGSTGVYTPLAYVPGDEKLPFGPHPYEGFAGKFAADRAALEYAGAGQLEFTVLRPCCIAGPGKTPLDNLGGRRADFIPGILNGEIIDLPDRGQSLLQLVHIRDLARAFVLAAERKNTIGKAYNICSSKAVTLQRYCELNAEALGVKANLNYLPFDAMIAKYGEEIRGGLTFLVEHMCFDIALAREELGFEPQYTIGEAIASAAQWTAQILKGQKG